MSTEATVVIKGRNDLSYAVKQAEQQLRGLARTGELIGKVFRGGAIVGAIIAFERLAENAEEAAKQIGDEGTAKALGQLNRKIDELKSKGTNLIGQVLGGFATAAFGSEADKAALQMKAIDQRIGQIKASVGPNGIMGPGLKLDLERLEKEKAQLQAVIALAGTFNDRRLSAVTRGGGSGVLTRYSSEFDNPAAAKARGGSREFSLSEEGARQIAELQRRTDEYYDRIDYRAEVSADLQRSAAGAVGDIADQMEREYETASKQNDQMTVYAEQAARNMQDSFAQFLFDPFDEGIKGMLKGFVDMIRRMVAEAAASQILGAFFSWGSGLGGSVGKFFGSMAGARASGGPVSAGRPYLVGERGPEMFIPGASGSILANGGGGIVLNYSIDARGADAERIAAMMPPLLKRTKDETVGEIRALVGRGRL